MKPHKPTTEDVLAQTAITGVTPGSLVQRETATIQITGNKTNFTSASAVSFSGTGIVASGVTATSGTALSASVAVDASAPAGLSDVTVTTGSEVATGVGLFTVEAAPPAAIYLSPASAMRGTAATVQVNGTDTHFDATSVVSFAGAGITVSDVSVLSATMLRVTIAIDPFADLGQSGVTVSTGSEHATGGLFTVELNPALVKITSVNPAALPQGSSAVVVQVTGQHTNFDATSVVSFAGAGIEITAYSLVSATVMQATISIALDAPFGPSDVTVTTGSEVATGAGVFTVEQNPAGALIASVVPATVAQGDSVRVELVGQNTHFDETSTVAFAGAGIEISDLVVAGPTTIRVTATIDMAAASGPSDVTVTTGAEIATGLGVFTVVVSTVKAEVLREAVNTYLRLIHVTDPAAVAICEEFIASINQALRGQVDGSASGVMVSVRAKPAAPKPPDEGDSRSHLHSRHGRKP